MTHEKRPVFAKLIWCTRGGASGRRERVARSDGVQTGRHWDVAIGAISAPGPLGWLGDWEVAQGPRRRAVEGISETNRSRFDFLMKTKVRYIWLLLLKKDLSLKRFALAHSASRFRCLLEQTPKSEFTNCWRFTGAAAADSPSTVTCARARGGRGDRRPRRAQEAAARG